jgi:hypothetical protein
MTRLIALFVLLAGAAFAQKPLASLDRTRLAPGVPVAADAVRGQLTEQDFVSTNAQGQARFTDAYSLSLVAGEELVIEYASPEYRVMLGLKKPDQTFQYAFDSLAFEGLSSYVLRYRVPRTGTYTLLVTTADARQAGQYLLRKFLFPAPEVPLSAGADFCARVRYLVAHRRLSFARIQGEKLREDRSSGETMYYRARVEILPGRPAEIFTEDDLESLGYKTTLLETTDEAAARRAFDEYAAALRLCTPDWEQETDEQEDFFREVSAATYTDFISITLRRAGLEGWRVEFNYN